MEELLKRLEALENEAKELKEREAILKALRAKVEPMPLPNVFYNTSLEELIAYCKKHGIKY